MTKQSSHKKKTYDLGVAGEKYAALYLQAKGYRILEKRFKTRYGEIDIIAEKKNTLAIIEVKSSKQIESALYSITPQMQKRIENATLEYLRQNPDKSDMNISFDFLGFQSPIKIIHLDNAWRPAA